MPNNSESVPELLIRVAKAIKRETRIDILRSYRPGSNQTLTTILQGAFHPDVVWDLPEGAPPYKKQDGAYGLCDSILEKEVRKLVYLTPWHPSFCTDKLLRQKIFTNMLEGMHPTESELLIQMKDKKILCRGLTAQLVWEAFDNLIPEPVKKKPVRAAAKVADTPPVTPGTEGLNGPPSTTT